MVFDMHTLIFVLGITQLIQFIVFLQQSRIKRAYGGVFWWLLWSGAELLGYVFMLLRQVGAVSTAAIFLQNTCLVAGMLFLYVGVLRFLGRKEDWPRIIPGLAVFLALFAYFLFVREDIHARGLVVSAAFVVILACTVKALHNSTIRSIASAVNFISVVLLVYCALFIFRIGSLLVNSAPFDNFFAPTPLNYIPALVAVTVNLLLTFGFIILMNQRLYAEMKEAKEHSELVFSTSPDGAIITRLENGIIRDVNKKFTALTGFTREDSLGNSTLALKLWEDPDGRRSVVHDILSRGSCDNFEAVLLRKDGSRFFAAISSTVITLEGEPYLLSVVRDVSARKQAEMALSESEERYRNLFANSPDAIYINHNNRVALANNACAKLFGAKTSEDLVGKSVYDLFHPDSHSMIRERISLLRSEGKPVPAVEHQIIRMDGRVMDVDVLAAPFYSGGGRDIHVILRDITERKKAQAELKEALEKEVKAREVMVSMLEDNNQTREKLERNITELKRAQDMLVQSEKMASLGKLVSEIAHEVNNPLMIISGNAQLSLMSEQADEEMKSSLRIIMGECQRAKSIIQRLLKFSQPSKGETREVDINMSLEAVVAILEKQFKLANVEFTREYGQGLPRISIDEQQMQEVFMNLINNAKESMDRGGNIAIRTSFSEGRIRIDFEDDGCGMTEEAKRNLLEPFFTTKEKGTGLGLPVCYGILKAHNGELKFESVLHKGTVATVLLPAGEGMPDA